MAKRSRMALGAQSRRVLVAAFLVLGLASAAGAFAAGFTAALTQSLSDPATAPGSRLIALARFDESLGYSGFLKSYREFLLAGGSNAQMEMQRYAADAELSLDVFLRASASGRDRNEAGRLRVLAAPFQRTALFGAGAVEAQTAVLVPFAELERSYAALKSEIATAAQAANLDRVADISDAFVWAEAMSVAALSLLACVLFALAWFMRERVIAPLANLRASVSGAAAGAIGAPLWGIERKDEVGALARAADRLRQSAASGVDTRFAEVTARLNQGADRLEADLARMALAADEAQMRVEASSARAARASHAAVEAAGLAKEGAALIAKKAGESIASAGMQTRAAIDVLAKAASGIADTAARLDRLAPRELGSAKSAPESGARDAVLDDLIGDLDALERFARERKDIAGDQAVAFTAALIEAIDRLNAIAERVSAAADENDIRKAG